MITKHNMLDVAERAMHNPRAAWFTVRPLSKKPMPYPFSVEGEAAPAIVAQFAVEHPSDLDARRVISIATTEYGYSVWCGDKFTQGDVTALDASLRVAMAVSELPQAYVEGAREAMMSLYGSYPLRAPCHFWHAWHKDQGVCKHVAAALQYVERTHPEGLAGLLDELDDMLNSLTTAPLADLLAPRPRTAATEDARAEGTLADRMECPFPNRVTQADKVGARAVNSLAAMQSLADLTLGNPAIKQFFSLRGDTPAAQADKGQARIKPSPDSDEDFARDTLKSLGNVLLTGPMSKHPLFMQLVSRALQAGPEGASPRKAATPAAQPSAPTAPQGHAEYASRLAIQAQARLLNLVPTIQPELKQTLVSMAGKVDASDKFVVWPVMRIVGTNEQLRGNPEFQVFGKLLFIADTASEDGMFALHLDADGTLRRPDVYRWDQKTKKVEWYAEDLAIYLVRRASEG